MKGNPVSWFEIYVDDMNRAKKFYESVFDVSLQLVPGDPKMQMWMFAGDNDLYGAHGALVQMPGFKAGKNSVIVYFACKDCREEEKKVLAAGGQIQRPKMSVGPNGYISLVMDSEGNMIGLHSFQ